jgi:hypothetical protein
LCVAFVVFVFALEGGVFPLETVVLDVVEMFELVLDVVVVAGELDDTPPLDVVEHL